MSFPRFDSPYFVRADRTRLKQVLINLLSNAIKYNISRGRRGGVQRERAGRIRVSIADTGAGLHPEQVTQLFQPFNRLGQEAGGEEGTGIGLVVAKRLVELMGGVIGVESTVGLGSVFWFELPPRDEARPLGRRARPQPASPRRACQRRAGCAPALRRGQPGESEAGRADRRAPPRHPPADARSDGDCGIELARASPAGRDPDGHQPARHQRPRGAEDPARGPGDGAHPRRGAQRQRDAPRHQEGLKAGFFRYLTKPIKVDEFMETLEEALESAGWHAVTDATEVGVRRSRPRLTDPPRRGGPRRRHRAGCASCFAPNAPQGKGRQGARPETVREANSARRRHMCGFSRQRKPLA